MFNSLLSLFKKDNKDKKLERSYDFSGSSNTLKKSELELDIYICGDFFPSNLNTTILSNKVCKPIKTSNVKKSLYKHKSFGWNYTLYQDEFTSIISSLFDDINSKIIEGNEKNVILVFINNIHSSNFKEFENKRNELIEYTRPHVIIITKTEIDQNTINDYKKKFHFIINYQEEDLLISYIYKKLLSSCSFYNELGDNLLLPINGDVNLTSNDNNIDKEYSIKEDEKYFSSTLNIAVIGQFGSGKSSLINKLLGEEKCRKGQGVSKTRKVVQYFHSKYPISIYDTPGFENDNDIKILKDKITELSNELSQLKTDIHIILFCENITSRPKNEEFSLFKFFLQDLKLNSEVYIVLTKSQNKTNGEEFKKVILHNLKKEKKHLEGTININEYFPDRTIPINIEKTVGVEGEEIFGIKELLEQIHKDFEGKKIKEIGTLKKLSEQPKDDKIEEQMVKIITQSPLFLKIQKFKDLINRASYRANIVILSFSMASLGVGASPLPFSDSLALGYIEGSLLFAIGLCYGFPKKHILKWGKSYLKSRITAEVLAVSGMVAGNLLKFIPGLGTITGAALNAAIASGTTALIGKTTKDFFENQLIKIGPQIIAYHMALDYNEAIDSIVLLDENKTDN